MASPLKEQLRDLIDRTTNVAGLAGFISLTCVSLSIPDLNVRTLPTFLVQFRTFSDVQDFLVPKIAPLLLIVTTVYWYYRYKGAVLKELTIVDDVFEQEHAPRRIAGLDGHRFLIFIGYLLVVTFCALIVLAPYLPLYCLVALVLHGTDLAGNTLVLQNLTKLLAKFPIGSERLSSKFAQARRDVVKDYYFGNPTMPRIGATFLVTALVLVISLLWLPANRSLYFPSYALLVFNILISEHIMSRWRAIRDQKLEEIAKHEEDASVAT